MASLSGLLRLAKRAGTTRLQPTTLTELYEQYAAMQPDREPIALVVTFARVWHKTWSARLGVFRATPNMHYAQSVATSQSSEGMLRPPVRENTCNISMLSISGQCLQTERCMPVWLRL